MNDTMLIDTNNAEKALGDAQAEFISARKAEDIALTLGTPELPGRRRYLLASF